MRVILLWSSRTRLEVVWGDGRLIINILSVTNEKKTPGSWTG